MGAKIVDGYKGWHEARKITMYSSTQCSYFWYPTRLPLSLWKWCLEY